ncbi:transmembrane protein [Cystoisospora suis]|uniref:Transmembrane protein n=1 Tax=Cystoisospora suis TaxID=483139 RepID=A0A2C6L4T1_9APIC|nr:transmembrane protein [Cystoisospora suis]
MASCLSSSPSASSARKGPLVSSPPSSSPSDLPALHIITVATHRDGYLTSLIYSSTLLHADINVLYWRQKWRGFGTKLMATLDFCRQVPPGDVVMLTDGFDTVLLQPKDIILRKFLEFGGRIVMSGESTDHRFPFFDRLFLMYHDCIFRTDLKTHWPKPLPYASKNVDLRRVNSGGVIGFAKDIVRVYSDADYWVNDQRYLSNIFLSNPHKDITVDYNGAIFCVYTSERDLKFLSFEEAEKQARHAVPSFPDEPSHRPSLPPAPTFARTAFGGVLMDTRTNEVPCVLHMHCRRNADSLTDRLGLPRGENILSIRSYLWYAFFSVTGTVFTDKASGTKWAMALVSTTLSCLSFLGLALNLLACGMRWMNEKNGFSFLRESIWYPIYERVAPVVYVHSTSHKGGGSGAMKDEDSDILEMEERMREGQRSMIGDKSQSHYHVLGYAIYDLLCIILGEVWSVCTAGMSWVLDTAEQFRGIFILGAILGVSTLILMIHFIVGWRPRDSLDENEEEEPAMEKAGQNKHKKNA